MLLLEKAIMRKKELEKILGIVEKQLKDAPKGNPGRKYCVVKK